MAGVHERIEWLRLIDIAGPFLAGAVLEDAFPQGLETVETLRRQRLRSAYEEWREAIDEGDDLAKQLHCAWTRMVLQEALEYEDEVLVGKKEMPDQFAHEAPEHGVRLVPDYAVRTDEGTVRLLIAIYPPETDLEKPLTSEKWAASPAERMTLLCRTCGVRVGLVTDGERWMLVNAPIGNTSGTATWLARLWWQEPITLKAFQSLVGVRRCFGPENLRLEQMLERSIEFQEEVTDTLGEQVRRAVEVLIQALGRADQDRNGELLRNIGPVELFEAGLTVMMRLVFVLCAEERGLLLLGDQVYDQFYALSTLRSKLRKDEFKHGDEVLERRHDAWSRILTVFRMVFGGIDHESLRLPALGGSLFDPDCFPFLEGRARGTCWRDVLASPLPIDNRTVLLLLEALQVLEQSGGAQYLSYRALDVEQIGHVYEGLLEYSVIRAEEPMVGLLGSKISRNPMILVSELERLKEGGIKSAAKAIGKITGRTPATIERALESSGEEDGLSELILACSCDEALAKRLFPFMALVRRDSWGHLLVYQKDTFAITLGDKRKETGTHYTPRILTEAIVEKTLEPIVYDGPIERNPRFQWTLKPPSVLLNLKICDPAMGSGAFLVQVCRWLAERLVEAWRIEEDSGKTISVDGVVQDRYANCELIPGSQTERLLAARRLIAERCLFGVDINPLAVSLAKLSIWLTTMSKNRPFSFLDHSFRCGDSLLGIHNLDQLTKLKITPTTVPHQHKVFGPAISKAIEKVIEIRKKLCHTMILDIRNVEMMTRLNHTARKSLKVASWFADEIVNEILDSLASNTKPDTALSKLGIKASETFRELEDDDSFGKEPGEVALGDETNNKKRRYFHWPLEFPEVLHKGGFDAFLSNPPFGSTIGGTVTEETLTREFWRLTAPEVTTGAFDRANVFICQGAKMLRPGGTYGFLLPQSILSPGGGTPLQKYLNLNAPPFEFFVMENPRLFGGANVFVSGIIGMRGGVIQEKAQLHLMTTECDFFETHLGEPSFLRNQDESWWEWISKLRSSKGKVAIDYSRYFEPLTNRFKVFAGCATGAAYELAPLVVDDENGSGLCLITTGAIDRFANTWGIDKQKFLKREFFFPRWPFPDQSPKAVASAYLRQMQPKIVLGGLTKTLEGFYDSTGLFGGTVSTWVIVPKSASDVRLLRILELFINSQVVSWEYARAYGGQKSPWGGMTIKKNGLESLPFPKELFQMKTAGFSLNAWDFKKFPWDMSFQKDEWRDLAINALIEKSNEIDVLRRKNDILSLYSLVDDLQATISWLYCKTNEEALEISDWFKKRDRLNRPEKMYEFKRDK